MKKYFLSAVTIILVMSTEAQYNFPALSAKASLQQQVGFTTIKIDYERPSARGRKIFDGVVPFDKLWRTGAGHCTTITFNTPVLIHSAKINAGSYAVLSIPQRDAWMIILNRDTSLYGVNRYDSTKDVMRFTVRPQKTHRYFKSLTFDIDVIGNNADLFLSWENTRIHFPVCTLTDQIVMEYISTQLLTRKSTDWNEYAGAVEYYLYNNKELKEALILADGAIANNGELYSYLLKVQVLEKQQKYASAIEVAKTALEFVETNRKRFGYGEQEKSSLQIKIEDLSRKLQ